MTFNEMICVNRKRLGVNRQEFAQMCGIPVELVDFIEEPEITAEQLIVKCASALGMNVSVFRGEEQPQLTPHEKIKAIVSTARFPHIRQFLCTPEQCLQPDKAIFLFSEEKFSLAERNLVLYLSTTALYNFCDTNSSSFQFHEYLFNLHSQLFRRFEENIKKSSLANDEQQKRIDIARLNIFACDSMENIAIRILESFAEELETRLPNGLAPLNDDLELPFRWDVDDELLKISIINQNGTTKDEIRLLNVKERVKPA